MASKQMHKTFEYFYSLNEIVKFLPFDCPKNSHVIQFTTKKLKLCNWICLSVGIFLVTAYLTIRLIYEIFNPSPSFTVPQIMLFLVFLLVTLVTDAMNFTLGWKGQEFVFMHNAGIHMDDVVKERTWKAKPFKEPKIDIIAVWLRTQIPLAIGPAIFVALFAVLHEIGPVNLFIKECIPVWLANWFITPIFAILATFVGLMFCIFVVMLYLHCAVLMVIMVDHWQKFAMYDWPKFYIKVLKMKSIEISENDNTISEKNQQVLVKGEKKTQAKGKTRKNVLLTPEYVLDTLRSLYGSLTLMNTLVNNHCILVSTVLMFVAFVLTVLVVYANIALRNEIPMPYFLFFPVINNFLVLAEAIIIPRAALLNTQSEKFISNWKNIKLDMYMRKWLKSVPYVRLNVGPFFYINRDTTLDFFSNVLDRSIDLILTF